MNDAVGSSTLRQHAAWAFAGQGSYLACQWLLLTLFARVGGAEAVGLYALALAVTGPLIVFANLSLRELLLSDTAQRFHFQDYLALRLLAMIVALVAVGGICIVMGWSGERTVTLLALAAAKVVESVADLGNSAAQVAGRFAGVAISQAARGVVGLALAGGVFLSGGGVDQALIALLIGSLVVLMVVDLPRIARLPGLGALRPRLDPQCFRQLLILSVPMGVAAWAGSLLLTIPSYVIESSQGTADLGRYAALAYLLLPGNLLMMALGQAASPRLARLVDRQDIAGFRALTIKLCGVALGVTVAALLACSLIGEQVLTVVLGGDWHLEAPVLRWLALASGAYWLACALGVAATAARRLRPQLPLTLVACACSLGAACALVPAYGLIGAAWTSIVANVVLMTGLVWMVASVRSSHSTPQASP